MLHVFLFLSLTTHTLCVPLCACAKSRACVCERVKGCALVYIFRNVCMYLLVSDLFLGPTPFLFYYLLRFVFLSFFLCTSVFQTCTCLSVRARACVPLTSFCLSVSPPNPPPSDLWVQPFPPNKFALKTIRWVSCEIEFSDSLNPTTADTDIACCACCTTSVTSLITSFPGKSADFLPALTALTALTTLTRALVMQHRFQEIFFQEIASLPECVVRHAFAKNGRRGFWEATWKVCWMGGCWVAEKQYWVGLTVCHYSNSYSTLTFTSSFILPWLFNEA